ncbi:hypothetical protein TNCV_472241, partial [Trichonephila clavipes]
QKSTRPHSLSLNSGVPGTYRERPSPMAGVKGTHRTGRRANRPPPCSLLATVKRDIGHPVACFFWPVRQCTGHLRVWFLVDDHY